MKHLNHGRPQAYAHTQVRTPEIRKIGNFEGKRSILVQKKGPQKFFWTIVRTREKGSQKRSSKIFLDENFNLCVHKLNSAGATDCHYYELSEFQNNYCRICAYFAYTHS